MTNFFKTYEGLIAAIISLLFAISLFLISPSSVLPTWICIMLSAIILFMIWGFLIWEGKLPEVPPSFLVNMIQITDDNHILFASNMIDFFQVDSYFTIYYKKNNIERILGIGRVIHIQSNNIVQGKIISPSKEQSLLCEELRIVPTLSLKQLSYLLEYENMR